MQGGPLPCSKVRDGKEAEPKGYHWTKQHILSSRAVLAAALDAVSQYDISILNSNAPPVVGKCNILCIADNGSELAALYWLLVSDRVDEPTTNIPVSSSAPAI